MKLVNWILGIIKYLIVFVLLFIICSNLYLVVMNNIKPNEHHSILGYSTAVVVSGSMQPALNVDDMIIIQERDSYNVGDIVAFKSDDSFITHRIVEKVEDGFITKGDANNSKDLDVLREENIVGKVLYIFSSVGKYIYFLRSPMGLMCVLLLGLCILLLPSSNKKIVGDN